MIELLMSLVLIVASCYVGYGLASHKTQGWRELSALGTGFVGLLVLVAVGVLV